MTLRTMSGKESRPSLSSRVRGWVADRLSGFGIVKEVERVREVEVKVPVTTYETVYRTGETRIREQRLDGSRVRESGIDVPPGSYGQDYGWRRLTQGQRDLTPITHDRALQIAMYLKVENGLAKRIIELERDFIVAEGFTPQAKTSNPEWNKDIQDVLDGFWNDPVGKWDMNLPTRVEECCMTGELILHQFTRKRDGRVRMGLILPENVLRIHYNPLNSEELTHVELKFAIPVEQHTIAAVGSHCSCGMIVDDLASCLGECANCGTELGEPCIVQKSMFEIVHRDEKAGSPTWGRLVGDVFYFGLNRMGGATRGLSELLAVADWIDILDQIMFSESERAAQLKMFVWDVLLKNATPQAIQEWKERNKASPHPGSVNAHSDQETWQAISPNLQLGETIDFLKWILLWILGSVGIPEHFFSEANTVSKACHSSDTETLTREGWKSLDELRDKVSDSIEIATLNPITRNIEWQKPSALHVYQHQGTMIHFNTNKTDILVTPDHRMWAKRQRNDKNTMFFETIKAGQMSANKWHIPVSGNWSGGQDTDFVLPGIPLENGAEGKRPQVDTIIPGDLWAEFLGWMISGGHWSTRNEGRHYGISVAQKKSGIREKLITCIERMNTLGFNFTESKDYDGVSRWQTWDKSLCIWLRNNAGVYSYNKYLPSQVWSWTKRRMRILFDALMLGDGSWDPRENTNYGKYASTSLRLADDLQILALHLGYQAKVKHTVNITRTVPVREKVLVGAVESDSRTEYHISEDERNNPDWYNVLIASNSKEVIHVQEAIQLKQYKGEVYCFTVLNGLVITRRNGFPAITHNSAEEMSTPVFARIRRIQNQVKDFFEQILQFVVERKILAGVLSHIPQEELAVELITRDPERKGYETAGKALLDIGNALALAQENLWITQDEAARAYRMCGGSLGIEFDDDNQNAGTPDQAKLSGGTDDTPEKDPTLVGQKPVAQPLTSAPAKTSFPRIPQHHFNKPMSKTQRDTYESIKQGLDQLHSIRKGQS